MHLEEAELNGEKVGVDIQTISCCKDSTAVEGIARYSISARFVLVTIQIKSNHGCRNATKRERKTTKFPRIDLVQLSD